VARFSQRVGGQPLLKSGLEEASQELRTATWNAFYERLLPLGPGQIWVRYQTNAKALWSHIHWKADEVPHSASNARRTLKDYWVNSTWMKFFDAFEFVVHRFAPSAASVRVQWFQDMNLLLEEQGCAYRFISEELAPVTNPAEMAEVEKAAECSIAPVAQHIHDALGLLPPNPNSSARNSVKESISAVEAALKHLTGEPTATLGEALKLFESKYGALHTSIRRGLDKLYAYTNGPDGIRHALVDDATDVTVDDARFMVITCSAFANYLVALASRNGY
jgi:hypothetical protein